MEISSSNILVLLQMEQMYASIALKLGLLGYDAVQEFTPRGETRKFVSSSKYLISEDILNVHTRKAKSMNLVFRHGSFTKGGEFSVGPDQNKNSAAFCHCIRASKQGYSPGCVQCNTGDGGKQPKKSN